MPQAPTATQESTHAKRARLDSTISLNQPPTSTPTNTNSTTTNTDQVNSVISAGPSTPSATAHIHHHHHHPIPHSTTASNDSTEDGKLDIPPLSFETSQNSFISTPTACPSLEEDHHHHHIIEKKVQVVVPPSTTTTTASSSSTNQKRKHKPSSSKIRKYRSRSLPNILFSSKNLDFFQSKIKDPSTTNIFSTTTSTTSTPPAPLPPVNIQSLREIDLAEILKNPQLRHDILFDPQLQFRPNLDGERGRRKKVTYDKYWSGVQLEIEEYYQNQHVFSKNSSRLPNLFQTLRDILISLLPSKDKQTVIDVLDIELIMQQLSNHSLDFVKLANWLSSIFKSHCAPMRDSWVDEMLTKFVEADESKSVLKLVEGLRMIFTILEAMKLDVANHQIRILRPVLVETAVEFERDYFLQMIARCKLDISDSVKWFQQFNNSETTPRIITTQAILSLLSCSKMVSEFPSSLAFDHARLIVLRANVRQVVCLQLCIALFKQLCHQSNNNQLITNESIESLKKEILALITDENGNVKWTRNIGAIALQISRRSNPLMIIPNEKTVEFAFSWLIKQTQPSSQVYSLMEQRVFNIIKEKVVDLEHEKLNNVMPVSGNGNVAVTSATTTTTTTTTTNEEDDIGSIASRISLLAKFHWNVFGSYYTVSE